MISGTTQSVLVLLLHGTTFLFYPSPSTLHKAERKAINPIEYCIAAENLAVSFLIVDDDIINCWILKQYKMQYYMFVVRDCTIDTDSIYSLTSSMIL